MTTHAQALPTHRPQLVLGLNALQELDSKQAKKMVVKALRSLAPPHRVSFLSIIVDWRNNVAVDGQVVRITSCDGSVEQVYSDLCTLAVHYGVDWGVILGALDYLASQLGTPKHDEDRLSQLLDRLDMPHGDARRYSSPLLLHASDTSAATPPGCAAAQSPVSFP
jgi:hypothetical protein